MLCPDLARVNTKGAACQNGWDVLRREALFSQGEIGNVPLKVSAEFVKVDSV
jgi:hypothetical protein